MSAIFYAGQRVKIINDTCGHGHEIGKVVTLKSAMFVRDHWDLEDEEEWVFDQDDCEPYHGS